LASHHSYASGQHQNRINAKIREVIHEDEELKKAQNENFSFDKTIIERNWKTKEYYGTERKQLSPEEFKD